MNFLSRFKELIKEKGVSISEISTATNIPRTTLSSYINRKSVPSAIQLEVLAIYFNTSVDYLLGLADDFGNIVISEQKPEKPLSAKEKRLLAAFSFLDEVEKDKLVDDAEFYAKRNALRPINK